MSAPQEQSKEPFSADGLERLLARAERDPSASAELDFLADLVAAADLERLQLAREPRPAPSQRNRLLERPWLVAAAASLLLAGLLTIWFLEQRPVALRVSALAQREPPRYVAVDLRAGDIAPDDAFAQAMERYASGDHAGAAAALSLWLETHPEHGPARFYLAACREQLGALDEAAAGYREVAERQPGTLGQHARWRLANLSLAREDVAGARAELARLLQPEGSFSAGAAELLRRLDGS